MGTLPALASSIAATTVDYRRHELGALTAAHVIRWVQQFDPDDQMQVLSEIDHVLKKTYFSEVAVTEFLEQLAIEPKLVGPDPASFWKGVGILHVQQGGNSQNEMLGRFDTVLNKQLGITGADCKSSSGAFVYLDDAVFSGNRVRRDLEPWIKDAAPQTARIHIVVNALHLGGEFFATQKMREAARQAGKTIETVWWRARSIENRRVHKNRSEVLWPTTFPEGGADEISAYAKMLTEGGHAPEKRTPGGTPKDGIFSSEAGRTALEQALLKAGGRIRRLCGNLPEVARPLGFSILKTFGFGATVVTYRNCPNNCPLAFWAGDPWYPLFRRKTN